MNIYCVVFPPPRLSGSIIVIALRRGEDTHTPAPPARALAVQNVVITAYVGTVLYLPAVARALKYGEYNPKRFSAVTFRLAKPRSTALIFSSGRIVCTGTKSHNEARLAVYKYVELLRERVGVQVDVYGITVQNMVSSATVGFYVDLARMFAENRRTCNYDPRLFPGLVLRDERTRVVLLVFRSGRTVVTGGKSRDDDGTWHVHGVGVGGFAEPANVIDCGNSGTGVRLIMGTMATSPITALTVRMLAAVEIRIAAETRCGAMP